MGAGSSHVSHKRTRAPSFAIALFEVCTSTVPSVCVRKIWHGNQLPVVTQRAFSVLSPSSVRMRDMLTFSHTPPFVRVVCLPFLGLSEPEPFEASPRFLFFVTAEAAATTTAAAAAAAVATVPVADAVMPGSSAISPAAPGAVTG
jgi:hypothetical protein